MWRLPLRACFGPCCLPAWAPRCQLGLPGLRRACSQAGQACRGLSSQRAPWRSRHAPAGCQLGQTGLDRAQSPPVCRPFWRRGHGGAGGREEGAQPAETHAPCPVPRGPCRNQKQMRRCTRNWHLCAPSASSGRRRSAPRTGNETQQARQARQGTGCTSRGWRRLVSASW